MSQISMDKFLFSLFLVSNIAIKNFHLVKKLDFENDAPVVLKSCILHHRDYTCFLEISALMAGIPRDVKELFILINGFEWKRRVCGKFDQAKFKQLVMEGSVSLV